MRKALRDFMALPELGADELWFEQAFSTLSAQRQSGWNGPQPIALGDILGWLGLCGMTEPAFRAEAVEIILALDRAMRAPLPEEVIAQT